VYLYSFILGVGTNSEDIKDNDTAYENLKKYAVKQSIAQIKKAFIDEGWINTIAKDKDGNIEGLFVHHVPMEGYMTGQEWYDRFEKELVSTSTLTISPGLQPIVVYSAVSVNQAAKRASGIGDKT